MPACNDVRIVSHSFFKSLVFLFMLFLGVGFSQASIAQVTASPNPSTSGSFTVSWPNASGNNIMLSQAVSGNTTVVYEGTGSSLSVSGKANGDYTYIAVDFTDQDCHPLVGCFPRLIGNVVVTVALAVIPPKPTGLTSPASDTNGSYTVSWNASSGASSYTLQRRLNSGGWSTIQNNSARSRSESGLANGSYGYRVRACGGAGCSSYSATKTTTVLRVPGVPGAISTPASNSSGAYTVSWGAASGSVTSYTLQERVNSGSWSTIQSSSTRSIAMSNQLNGRYDYRTRACNGSGCSGYTSVKTTQVTIVLTISASPNPSTTGTVTLSWDTSVLNPDSYSVYDVTSGRTFLTSTTSGSAVLSGLNNGTYSFLVEAVLYTPETGTINIPLGQVSVTVTIPIPSVPTGLTTPASDTNGSYSVSWNAATGASTYTLQRRLNAGGWSTIQNNSARSKSESSLANGTYGYRVRACNSGGCSAYSAIKNTVVLLVPGVPGAISTPATNITGAYTVSWGAASGSVTSYTLQERINSGSWSTIQSSTARSFAASDKVNARYDYRTRACNGSGCSGYTSVKTTQVTIVLTISASPNPSTTGTVTLSWDSSVLNPDSYRVYDVTGGGRTLLNSTTSGSAVLSGLDNGTYIFLVEAVLYTPETGTINIPLGQVSVTVAIPIPPVPTGLTAPASDTNGSYSVSWSAASGASTYTLQRRLNAGGWSTIQNNSARSKSESGLANGTYGYRVRACNSGGCSAYSAIKNTVVLLVPGVPGAISTPATNITGAYTVSWGAASGSVTSYTLQERVDVGSWVTIQNTSARSIAMSGKLNGRFDYRTRACNGSGCSGYTAVKTTQVTIVLTISASPNPSTTGNVTLSWDSSALNPDSYSVYDVTDGGKTFLSSTTTGSAVLSGLSNGSYIFLVEAVLYTPETGTINIPLGQVSVTVAVVIPSVPTGLTAPTSDTDGSFSVSWNAATGASTYTLQRRLNAGGWSTIQDTSARSKSESSLANGTYGYRVRACNSGGCSAYSAIKNTVVLLVPGVPGVISTPATNISGAYTVSWGVASGSVVSYTLQERVDVGSWVTIQNTSARSIAMSDQLNGRYDYRTRACNGSGCSGYTAVKTTQVSIVLTIAASPNPSTTGNVTLSWDSSVLNPDSYSVYDVTDGGKTFLSSTTTGSAVLSGLNNGSYIFLVEAVLYTPETGTINIPLGQVSVTVAVVIPPVPTGLTAPTGDTDGSFSVSWNAATGASTYTLQRQLNAAGWSTIQDTSARSKSESSLANGSYGYRVRACNSGGCSAYSATQTTVVLLVPGVPGAISTPASSISGAYTVSWGVASGSVTRYNLEERKDAAAWTTIQNTSARSIGLSGKLNGTFDYRVSACNSSGCGAVTAVQTTQVTILLNISVSPNPSTTGTVTLSWDNSVINADTYSVYDITDGGRTLLSTVTTGPATVNGLSDGTYILLVEATITTPELGTLVIPLGEPTVTVAIVLVPPTLTVPATDDDGSFSVIWSATTGGSYTLERQYENGTWSTLYAGDLAQWDEVDLSTGKYGYRVNTCLNDTCSGVSLVQSIDVVDVPGVPGPITTPESSTNGNYAVSWSSATGIVDTYTLEERYTSSGEWLVIQNTSALSSTLSDRAGGNYSYRVKACNVGACGAYTAEQSTLVYANATITATPNPSTTGTVILGWEAVVAADNYHIYDITGGALDSLGYTQTLSITLNNQSHGDHTYQVYVVFNSPEIGSFEVPIGSVDVVVNLTPGIPSGISSPVSNGSGDYTVTWLASTGSVDNYRLQEQANSSGWVLIDSPVGLSSAIEDRINGAYQYRVAACNTDGCSEYSSDTSTTTVNLLAAGVPGPITGPNTNDSGNYSLAWTAATGAVTSYLLQEQVDGDAWSEFQNADLLSVDVFGKGEGTYGYQVAACNSTGCGAFTAVKTVAVSSASPFPGVPGGISGPAIDEDGEYTITWNPASGTITHYELEEQIDGADWGLVPGVTGTSILLTSRADGNYLYRVKACNGDVCSDYGDELSVVVLHIPGMVGSIVAPANNSTGSYTVSWDEASGAVETYQLEERSGAIEWTVVQNTSEHSMVFSEKADASYEYRVAACNASGCGDYSDIVTTIVVAGSALSGREDESDTPAPKPNVGASLIAASEGVGSMGGFFRVNESGAATYSVPITVGTGSAGVTPQLAINYSSMGSSGLLGKGWSLSGLSSISRCRQTLGQDDVAKAITWTEEDRFCLDGQRLVLISGSYGDPDSRYKTEMDSFATITAVGDVLGSEGHFSVARKDGSISLYGESSDSKVSTSDDQYILSWLQSEYKDSVGNPIVFEYKNDAQGPRIDRINYAFGTSGSGGTPAAYVQFIYQSEDRADSRETYVAGYLFPHKALLSSVTSYSDGEVVRHYLLEYAQGELNNVPKLQRLNECVEFVSVASLANCLKPTEFTWINDVDGFNSQLPAEAFNGVVTKGLYGWKPADINGDGMMDLVWLQWAASGPDVEFEMRYMLSGDGELKQTMFTNKAFVSFDGDASREVVKMEIIDYNADGRQDVMVYSSHSGGWNLYLSTLLSSGEWRLSGTPIDLGIASSEIFLADANSDGLMDVMYLDRLDDHKLYLRLLEQDPSQSISSNRFYRFSSPIDLAFNPVPAGTDEGKENLIAGEFDLFVYRFASAGDYDGDGNSDVVLSKTSVSCVEIFGCINHHQVWVVTLHNSVDGSVSAGFHYRGEVGYLIANDDETLANVFAETHSLDINGDGLSDVIYRKRRYNLDDERSWFYRLNHGASDSGGNYGSEQLLLQASSDEEEDYDLQFMDYNQDGVADVVWNDIVAGKIYARYGDGVGGFSSTQEILDISNDENHAHVFIDMNGDGRPDYLHVWDDQFQVSIAQGSLQPSAVISTITNALGSMTQISYGSLGLNGNYERLGAMTNQGQICIPDDLTLPIGSLGCTDYDYSFIDADTLYSALNADWELPAGSHGFGRDKPVLELTGPMTVVTRVSSSAPVQGDPNAESAISYYYGEAKVQASGRGMLGFQAIKTVDEQSGIETTTTYRQDFPFIGHPLTTVVRGPRQGDEDGVVLSTAQNIWQLKNFAGADTPKPYQPYVAESVELTYALSGGGLTQGELVQTVTTTNRYDNYGNPTEVTVLIEGGGDSLEKQTLGQYGSSVWEREKGRLSRSDVTTTRNGDSDTRSSTFTYYNSGHLKGLLLSEVVAPGDALSLTTTYEYDFMGNRLKSTQTNVDGVSRYSRSEYDALGRYVDRGYDSLGHLIQSVEARDYRGAPTEVTDVSGVSVYAEYDRFGSQYLNYSDVGSAIITLGSWCTGSCTLSTAVFKVEERSIASSRVNKVSLYDVLGRRIRESLLLLDGSYSHVDTEYDELGRVARLSEPHFGTATEWTTTDYDLLGRPTAVHSPLDTGSGSLMSYDAYTAVTTNDLGQRKTEVKNALGELIEVTDHLGGRLRYEYDPVGNLTAAVSLGSLDDPHNIRVEMTYDNLSRKIAMSDPDKGYWTYDYNAFGELIVQTDAKSQTRTLSYDRLGRMISRIDRLASGVIEGDTQWFYDTAANGLGQLDYVVEFIGGFARFYQYDQYGRGFKVLTSHDESGGFDYMTQTVYDPYNRIKRHYDSFDLTAISGGSNGSNGRDSTSSTSAVSVGSGIHNYYNSYGHLSYITDIASNDEVYRVSEQNVRGQVTSAILGNGSISRFDYDAKTGRLQGQYAQLLIGQQIQSIEYEWDSVGNLETRHNTSGSRNLTETFAYDGLNRLLSSTLNTVGISKSIGLVGTISTTIGSVGGSSDSGSSTTISGPISGPIGPFSLAGVNTMTYNSIGNILSKTGVGTYTYGQNSAGPHAVSTTGDGVTYSYDANGNLTADTAVGSLAGRSLTYTSFDKPSLITKGNHRIAFKYGPGRSRYLRTDTNSDTGSIKETRYLGSVERISELGSDTVQWKRMINGVAIYTTTTSTEGEIRDTEKTYLYKDHLGSLDFITDGNGTVIQEMSFDAWGQRRNAADWSDLNVTELLNFDHANTTRGFTGQEMLDEVGLIHMNGRVYDPRLGRFLQADPFIQVVADTQMYNRYSYVRNNPLNATDPSGYFIFSAILRYTIQHTWVGKNIIQPYMQFLGSNAIVNGIVSAIIGYYGGPEALALYAEVMAYSNGASLFDGMKAGAISYASSSVFSAIGGADHLSLPAKALAHGMVGGVMAELQGGKFAHGFASAGLTKLANVNNMIGTESSKAGFRIATAAIIGGTISKVSGGKFVNGAGTAAFAQVFNGESEAAEADKIKVEQQRVLDEKAAEITKILELYDFDRDKYPDFKVRFASGSEIKRFTSGVAAWGTIARDGTILIDEGLASNMEGTRFIQTLAEELTHAMQFRLGGLDFLSNEQVGPYVELEATDWVISKRAALGLGRRHKAFKDYKNTNKYWRSEWRKVKD